MSKRKLCSVLEAKIEAVRLSSGLGVADGESPDDNWQRLDELYSDLDHARHELMVEEREKQQRRAMHVRGMLAFREQLRASIA